MPHTDSTKDNFNPRSLATSRTALVRLGIGLVQGLVLYFLYRARVNQSWPGNNSLAFSALAMMFVFVPILMISSLGHLANKTLLRWFLIATVSAASLGFYDSWRSMGVPVHAYGNEIGRVPYPSPLLWMFGAAGFYIAHALVLASATDQRRIASYPTYFDSAWKLLIQIKFSSLFTGAFWLVLWLGAGLFDLIKLNFLKELLQESWFAIPVTVFAFACAMHLTDVRPAIVRGIRNMLLVLLSWILPLAVLIIGGFLLSLPFTGLTPLWATKHATALLLCAAAVLVVLINTAFQNGSVTAEVARVLRISARLASFLLLPLIVIAIYALSLRVGDYGWTTDRIIAASCLLVASCYALGYAWAASRKHDWLSDVAPVNVGTAFVVIGVLLALFSPLSDPARVSVKSQIAKLENGSISAEKFDFDYLKREGKRYGLAELQRLKLKTDGANADIVREKATQALLKKDYWEKSEPLTTKEDLRKNLKIWPANSSIPDSFLGQDWNKLGTTKEYTEKFKILPECLKNKDYFCELYLIDFDGDGKQEILVISLDQKYDPQILFRQQGDASWYPFSQFDSELARCQALLDHLKTGDFRLEIPDQKVLVIAGQKFRQRDVGDQFSVSRCESSKK